MHCGAYKQCVAKQTVLCLKLHITGLSSGHRVFDYAVNALLFARYKSNALSCYNVTSYIVETSATLYSSCEAFVCNKNDKCEIVEI